MPQFIYTIKNVQGKTKTDMAEALDEQSLIERLQAQGLYVLEISQTTTPQQVITPIHSRVTKKSAHEAVKLDDLLGLAHQLATLLQAGLTLLQALNMIIPQIQSKQLARALAQVKDDVEQGKSFSEALAGHEKIFNKFWVSLVRVGEASGTMPKVLTKLAAHLEQQDALRSNMVSAMIYPLILFVASFGAILFFALVVAPKFETIFASMNTELPFVTRALLSTFNFIKTNIIALIAVFVGLGIAFKAWLGTLPGKIMFENFIAGLPILGEAVNMMLTERFAAQMAILVDAGVPILLALEIVEPMMEHHQASQVIAQAGERIRNGQPLAESIGQGAFFPDMAVQMIHVGEQTGDLGHIFEHIAGFYQSKVVTVVKRFSTIIEPFMLLFMASTIGIVVIAIFMPLFKLGQGSGH